MCLAIPAKVKKITGEIANVDFGGGVVRNVSVMLVDAQVGEYVLVHAGYAIQVVNEQDAEETLRLLSEILSQSNS